MSARRLAAAWVLPVDRAPIADGAVLIGADGRIEAVGPDALVPRPTDVPHDTFPGAALLPGFVNTHTHLELTGFGGAIAEREFAEWIRQLRQRKAERSREAVLAAARQGVADCWAAGVTTIADTGDSGTVIEALAEAGGSGIVYHEVFGPHPDDSATSLAGLRQRVAELSHFASERVRLGVSPHAPYTVSGPLYRSVAAWAAEQQLPMAVHLAESIAETALLATGDGAFGAAWRGRGIPAPSPLGCTPVEWLERNDVLECRPLCIHTVQVDRDDIARLARAGVAIAHCPLSNRAHRHGDAPLAALLDAGLRVGIGTDSVASVGTLDLLAEARAAQALAGLTADAALALCTIAGARALGLDGEIGSLRPGNWGDCVVIDVPHRTPGTEVVASIVASHLRHVAATYLAGKAVFRRS